MLWVNKYIELFLKIQNKCGIFPRHQDRRILNVVLAQYRAITGRIFLKGVRGYIATAMISGDMERKFKLVERKYF